MSLIERLLALFSQRIETSLAISCAKDGEEAGITLFSVEFDDGRRMPCAVRTKGQVISSRAEQTLLPRRIVLVKSEQGHFLEIEVPPKGEHCPIHLQEHLELLERFARDGRLPGFKPVK